MIFLHIDFSFSEMHRVLPTQSHKSGALTCMFDLFFINSSSEILFQAIMKQNLFTHCL